MEAEFRALEEKIRQLAGLCARLRTENGRLRQELAAAVNDNRQLADRMQGARARIETLLEKIPTDGGS